MKIEMGKKYKQRRGTPVRVLCVDSGDKIFPVIAISPIGESFSYTPRGQFHGNDILTGFDLIEDNPYADFKVDDKVMVSSDCGSEWFPRHFSHVSEGGLFVCFPSGRTSWSISYDFSGDSLTTWYKCRKPTAEELGE